MTDRPMIFSAPMVRALLDGRKTQTRRIIKPPRGVDPSHWMPDTPGTLGVGIHGNRFRVLHYPGDGAEYAWGHLPCAKSDQLWVKEGIAEVNGLVVFRAGHEEARSRGPRVDVPWCSPLFMPRRASRLTLVVTAVRVQRLHDISEADAVAEGCEARPFPGPWWQGYRRSEDGYLSHQEAIGDQPPGWMVEPHPMRPTTHLNRSARDDYRSLWNNLHGPAAWDANPWVVALTFDVIRANIDEPAPSPTDRMPAPAAEAGHG